MPRFCAVVCASILTAMICSGQASPAFEVADGSVAALPPTDVVVLNRVVCCYPDARRLLQNTLGAATSVYAWGALKSGPVHLTGNAPTNDHVRTGVSVLSSMVSVSSRRSSCSRHAANHLVNSSLLDYRMPTALDLPMLETVLVEVPNPGHPYGVRGVGEVPIVPPLAAIANAITHATGSRITTLPATPDRILASITRAPRQRAGLLSRTSKNPASENTSISTHHAPNATSCRRHW